MAENKPLRRQKHIPQRTCLVCRQKTDKRSLTRIVSTKDNGVLIDLTGKQNGRGAYICDQPMCWEKIITNKQVLVQALKTDVTTEEIAAIATQRPVIKA